MSDDKKPKLPPPSLAQRVAMAARISNSLAPPPSSLEMSIEINLGDGNVSSRRNPLTEGGRVIYSGQKPDDTTEKKEPAILQSQARDLSPSAARLIAKRRAMMEGQDQAGVFKLPRPGATE